MTFEVTSSGSVILFFDRLHLGVFLYPDSFSVHQKANLIHIGAGRFFKIYLKVGGFELNAENY